MKGPPLGPGGEDITWPDQVAPRGRKASSTRKIKPQTSNLLKFAALALKNKYFAQKKRFGYFFYRGICFSAEFFLVRTLLLAKKNTTSRKRSTSKKNTGPYFQQDYPWPLLVGLRARS